MMNSRIKSTEGRSAKILRVVMLSTALLSLSSLLLTLGYACVPQSNA